MPLLNDIRHANGVTQRFDTSRQLIAEERDYALGHWEVGQFVLALTDRADHEAEMGNSDTAQHFRAFAQILSNADSVTVTTVSEV